MNARSLTGAEKATLYNALRHAAGVYRCDAESCRRQAGEERLAEQFERQAREADALGDLIEFDCEDVELS